MQAHDPVDGLQNAASRVLEAISEHDKAAHNTYEPTSGVTGRNVSAFHNGFGFQHGVEPENTADTLPLPLPEPRVDTEAHAIDTVSQDTVASGTLNSVTGSQQTATPTQNAANGAPPIKAAASPETTTAPTSDIDAVTDIYLSLYLDEQADHDDPLGCVMLTGLTTRDDLFTMVQEYLESQIDEIDPGDKIVIVKIRRADGEVFQGPNIRTIPIMRAGKLDMWQELVKTLLVHGAGEGGLRGYVKVRRAVGAR
jgi:hypothetical protein